MAAATIRFDKPLALRLRGSQINPSTIEALHVTKAELGTKRVCPNCGTKYYDLNRDPIICPKCGTVFEVVAVRTRAAPAKAPVVAPVVEEEPVAEAAELVTLEDADDEAAEGGKVKTEGEEDEDEAEAEADDTFLEEEEENGEDVGDIIGDVDEEER
jgi:uncharacterized protein (TIGR02300 family)